MLVNSDFSRRAIVTPDEYRWVASPQGGVERVMLDRLGDEKARATSIVRYAKASHFPPHMHPGGEEVLVLSGTFSEGERDYPAGWYLRNPPGSSHRPSSEDGTTIFVKLWQMPASESEFVRVNTHDPSRWTRQRDREVCPLFSGADEQVALERVAASARIFAGRVDGAEILVLDGELREEDQIYRRGSWIRLPAGEDPAFIAGTSGVTIYLKTGHLRTQPVPPAC